MNIVYYIVFSFVFIAGIVGTQFVPESVFSSNLQFLFVGIWGLVLGFCYHCIAKRIIQNKEVELKENNQMQNDSAERTEPHTEYMPVISAIKEEQALAEDLQELKNPLTAPFEIPEPPENKKGTPFPLDAWNEFCKDILRNRPFSEVIESLEKALPKLFPNAVGILYMYGDAQSELQKIFSFGDYAISDDAIMPAECASFNLGEIVVNDYSSDNAIKGCSHLHYHPQGISFCAPIEGLEEHFGILCIQTDALPEGEDIDFWKAKVSIVSATFGLYVANQNLNIRFLQHSIRDNLTGLFNKRYMEESLRREIFAATRHKTPIGIIMLYPDQIPQLQETRGRHAVEQMLWELGQRLPKYIRNEDIPCRYKGDIFCVILPGADYKITKDRAERIRHEISELQVAYGDGILQTTLSIGVSVMPVHAIDVKSLIETADASMQMASANGGNRVVLAESLPK